MITQIKSYYNYILVLIGFGVASWIIWARFIRPRVPKDIPFELTEKWFWILVYICFIYLYMVYKLIRPGQPNEFIKIIVDLLFTPLLTFDAYIKNHKYMKPTYLKFVNKVVKIIQTYKTESEQVRIIRPVYVIFYIIPRAILVSILCLDTFYFHKLAWIYKVILLGVLPLLHRYVKYSIKYIKDQYIKDLDIKYAFVCLWESNWTTLDWEYNAETMKYHDTIVSIEEYIAIRLETDTQQIQYISEPLLREAIYVQYLMNKYNNKDAKLTDEDDAYLEKDFKVFIPIILDLSLFLKNYAEVDYIYLIPKFTHILIKHIKIIIFGLYGICWSYILIKSYHTLPYNAFQWLLIIQNMEEPFSGDL